jgi:hypothetical protein
MTEQIIQARTARTGFEVVLDPQLYVPATERGKLREWSYFPRDVDTADLSSSAWWSDLNEKLVSVCQQMKVDSICAPAVIPKAFNNQYYSSLTAVGTELTHSLSGTGIQVLQTAVVGLAELATESRPLQIASIISRTDADRVYLIFVGTTPPRRELADGDELKGAMQLITALEGCDLPVLVGFCSSDLILWKTAGASACASGKFFNLRRFTRQRFEEPSGEGGGQLSYWFEESLLAFLRQGDLLRVRREKLIGDASKHNPFCQEILANLDQARQAGAKPKPWLASGWRQFLYWFADVEGRLTSGESTAAGLLTGADENWSKLDKAKVLMEERQNDGSWIRSWRNIITEYSA